MTASARPPADDQRPRYFVLLGGAGVTEGPERGVLPSRLHQQGRAATQPDQYGRAWLSLTDELVRDGRRSELWASLGLLVPDPSFPLRLRLAAGRARPCSIPLLAASRSHAVGTKRRAASIRCAQSCPSAHPASTCTPSSTDHRASPFPGKVASSA